MKPIASSVQGPDKLAALRQHLAGRLVANLLPPSLLPDGKGTSAAMPLRAPALALGLPLIDAHLGGGLAKAALHEIAGNGSDTELAVLPAFFASQVIGHHPDQRVIWIAANADLYGPGLQAQGIAPSRLLLVEASSGPESLWALEEAARSGAASLVIGEIDLLDLTASRRLQLAAEEKTCTILALRRSRLAGGRAGDKSDKHRQPSAATTRWQISPLPSRPHPDDPHRPGLGLPCWQLHLWRQRNGPPGCWDITLQDHSLHQPHWQQVTTTLPQMAATAANDDVTSRPRQHASLSTG